MKCKYKDTWLTGTPWQEDCGEVKWTAQQLVQVTPLLGKNTPRIEGLGNCSDRIQVPILLNMEDPESALEHCATMPWNLPTKGDLYFEEGSFSITYENAVFNSVARRRLGERVELVFEFTVKRPTSIP